MDITPLYLNILLKKTFVRKGIKNVAIRINNQEKIGITLYITICAEELNIIFEGKSIKTLNKLKNDKYIINNIIGFIFLILIKFL